MVIASEPYDSQADLNSDGVINILDIITLVNIIVGQREYPLIKPLVPIIK